VLQTEAAVCRQCVGVCQVFQNEVPRGGGIGMMRLAGWKGWSHVTVEGDFLAPVRPFGSPLLSKAGLYNQAARQPVRRTIICQPQPDNPRHQRRAVTDDGDVLHMQVTQHASRFQDGIQVGGADQA
jgi:hypothetical protein